MKVLHQTLSTPAENLALDEALLDYCEESSEHDILRFWESTNPFVVVGYSNSIDSEVNVASCKSENIPILRRASGGGTILQGRGCFNYSLILKIKSDLEYANISNANRAIMERNRSAFQTIADEKIEVRGHTDLTWKGLKFSGNAQRRKKNYLLFHGTILYQFDLMKISTYLKMPSIRPAYRENKSHTEFVTNFPSTSDQIKHALERQWAATERFDINLGESVGKLTKEKYGMEEWIWKR